MKLSIVMLALAVSTAASLDAQRIQLGYIPTTNKHIAKRAKRKAAKQKARSCQPTAKEHKHRNKKGRP